MHGFDENYFVQQVAGLSQLAGEFMLVEPLVIDLGWGTLKSVLVKVPNSGFISPHEAPSQRQKLVNQYTAAFRHVEAGAIGEAKDALKSLAANISASLASEQQTAIAALVKAQIAKLG
jgi:hypothetical protein